MKGSDLSLSIKNKAWVVDKDKAYLYEENIINLDMYRKLLSCPTFM